MGGSVSTSRAEGIFLGPVRQRVRGLLFVVTIPKAKAKAKARARASGQRGRVLLVVPFGTEGQAHLLEQNRG